MKPEPYASDHARSLSAKAAKPKNLLAWFLDGYRAEMPTEIHSGPVWVGRPEQKGIAVRHGEGYVGAKETAGGSLLGAPGYEAAFRSFLEDAETVTEIPEYEGHKQRDEAYRFPMRAAIYRLAGRGNWSDPYPFMACFLHRTACRDGDFLAAGRSMGIAEPVIEFYLESALNKLWQRYEVEPPARPIRSKEAA